LQVVIRHVILSGWSYRRTADILKVSPMTIQRRLKRGLSQLRQALDGSGIHPSALNPGSDWHRAASAVPGC
jgi:DNA-directed RNA polymerase specialized sigma24 family protein